MKNSYDPRHFDVAIGTFNGCAEEREINRVKLDDAVKRWTRTTKERIRFLPPNRPLQLLYFITICR